MAIVTYPLNNIEYGAEDAELYNCTRTSGVFSADGNLDASAVSGELAVVISSGIAWINNDSFCGKVVGVKDDEKLTLAAPDVGLNRIDRIVLRFSAANNDTTLAVLTGTPSSKPAAPDITQTAAIYELGLYEVLIEPGATEIDPANITDTRLDESVCGLMADGVTRIPTAVLQSQFLALLEYFEDAIGGAVPDHASTHIPGGEDEIPAIIGVVAVADSLTLTKAHLGRHLYCVNSGDITITVPAGLGAGFNCTVERWGAGNVYIAPKDITINGGSNTFTLSDQYEAAVSVIALTNAVYSVKGGYV